MADYQDTVLTAHHAFTVVLEHCARDLAATTALGASSPRGRPPQCEPLRGLILSMLDQQLSGKRI